MHDKDEMMHMGVKNDTNLNENKNKKENITICSSDIEDKRRLVEIYLIISGLLMSGVQISNALISTSFNSTNISTLNSTNTSTLNANNYLTDVILFINIIFIVFVISILVYYVSFTVEIFNYSDVAPFVSLFFSFLIVSILNLQNATHRQSNNSCMTFCLWIPLFIIAWSTLSSIQRRSDNFFKILNNTKNGILKINHKTLIKLALFIIFSYILIPHMLSI